MPYGDLGIAVNEPTGPYTGRVQWGALIASALWCAAVAAWGLAAISQGGGGLLFLLGLFAAALVPVALLWSLVRLHGLLAARLEAPERLEARIAVLERDLRAQMKRVQLAESQIRKLQERPVAPPVPTAPPPAAAQPVPDTGQPAPEAAPDPQASLPLTGGAENLPQLSLDETIRALNFPRDANDEDGFAVLSRALATRDLAKLLQASEDCLNLLAHEGLYMDDLMPAAASAEDWRQFAKGGRARAELLPLRGITDTKALQRVRDKMRGDQIFRDTALHFQRHFDQILQKLAPEADESALLRLIDTRSGRAFVLLTQASGVGEG